MIHLEVAVAAPVTETLTYSFAAADAAEPQPGTRLLVPLGRRQVTGYLLAVKPADATAFKVKPVTEMLDSTPLFPAAMIPFFRWIASYYRYPLGEVIKLALPGGLDQQSLAADTDWLAADACRFLRGCGRFVGHGAAGDAGAVQQRANLLVYVSGHSSSTIHHRPCDTGGHRRRHHPG